ncbi:MAG: FG-GAP-like repeat-containing protein [Planctomycetota bacterium]
MQPNLVRIAALAALTTPLSAQFFDDHRSALPRAPGEIKDVWVADLNQDGVPDIVLSDGRGAFSGQQWQPTDYQGTYSVAIGDLDGDDDVLFGNGSTNEHQDSVVTNLGGGQWAFAPATAETEQEDTHQVLLGDLDRDGDLDYVAINSTGWATTALRSRVYRNHTRQLAAPLPPRVGRDYDLEVHGAPLGAGVWLSLQPANVATPLGVLGLGPVGLGPLTTLPAPTSGTVASQSFVLPNVPAMAGVTLYLQAIDVATLRLSNTLHETFVAW